MLLSSKMVQRYSYDVSKASDVSAWSVMGFLNECDSLQVHADRWKKHGVLLFMGAHGNTVQ
jgi:hypothetical protein